MAQAPQGTGFHGDATTTTRGNLSHLEDCFGAETARLFLSTLEALPTGARVLDIGCGEGGILQFVASRCPRVRFFGIDPQKPKEVQGYDFKQGAVEDLPTLFGAEEKFDLIFSTAALHYVADKKRALQNIARALKPDARAFIMIEPFYFGPYGVGLFQQAGVIEWNKERTTLILYAGDGNSMMQGFYPHPIPSFLQVKLYKNKAGPSAPYIEVPSYLSAEEIERARRINPGLGEDSGLRAIHWKLFEFLKVATYNPTGPDGAGDEEHRAFRFAAPLVYFPHEKLTPEQVGLSLLLKDAYAPGMLKPKSFRFSPEAQALRDAVYSRCITVGAGSASPGYACTVLSILAAVAAVGTLAYMQMSQ